MPGPAWNLMDPNAQPDFATFLAQQGGGAQPPPVTQMGLNAATPRAAAGVPPGMTPKFGVSRETRTSGLKNPAAATNALLATIDEKSRGALEAQGADVAAMQDRAQQLAGQDLPVNFSALAGLVDSWTGSKLAANAAPEETAVTRRAELDKLNAAVLKARQGMSQDEISILKDKLNAQWHADDIAGRSADRAISRESLGLQRDAAARDKTQRKNDQDLIKMSQDLDPSRASSKVGLGVATQKVANAKALFALTGGEENLDSRQTEELAIGLNKLISGTGAGAQAQIKALVPESARGDSQKMKEWLLNEPQGLGQQAFVRKLVQTIKRENEVATSDIEKYQRGKLAAYGHLKSHPDYEKVLGGYEDNYNVNLHPEAEDAAALAWAHDPANSGTPEAAEILKMHGGK